ncbi:polysaccharide deacetylase family protein [Methanosarcina sp. Mfa9]|uniref:polysaccharide deacetylase family protein n=1 Tax=Methanosarcina sp. Mfa9 TaxID=3439063 RepID=UPI003F826D7C
MTNDVECFSIPNKGIDLNIANEIYNVGIKSLLDLYAHYDVKSTFYFTGIMAETVPEAVELVKSHGHEIGCHSHSHSESKYLDTLSYEEQKNELKKAKKVIESISGNICSFRAPSLRMNEDTVRILEQCGFTSDSSMCSQRFDGPFIFGSRRELKTKWLFAHRKPYFLSYESLSKKGNSKILEIPISASLFSYSGNTMRRSPFLFKLLQKQLFYESKKIEKPSVFVFHPHECLDYKNKTNLTKENRNISKYYMRDMIKYQLKSKNLGVKSLELLDNVLKCAAEYGFEFVSASDYEKEYKNKGVGD